MTNQYSMFMAILLATTIPNAVHAEDLGNKGQTYAPDPSGVDQMRELARKRQASPENDRFWKDYRAKTIDAITHPKPLGVPTSMTRKVEMRELKFQFQSDFRDEKGNIIAKKGMVVEPLKVRPLIYSLVFIDGRDQTQIDYAIKEGQSHPVKIILTAGSALELRRKYQNSPWLGYRGVPFYFDQKKMILSSFRNLYGINLATVPVQLTQVGTQMKIQYGVTQ